jgi:SAM-dependent methyltransferase
MAFDQKNLDVEGATSRAVRAAWESNEIQNGSLDLMFFRGRNRISTRQEAASRDFVFSEKENDRLAVACALCGADDPTLVDVQRGYRMVECERCGLVYLNPRPTPEWLARSYQDYLPNDADAVANWNRMMAGVYRSARRRLIQRYPSGGRLLDVGCAYGRFLEIMRNGGWQVEGVEVCEPAVAACHRKSLPVQTATLATADLPVVRYDAVTLFYVLEHVTDPMGGLRKIHASLKPGGLCLARVPDTTPIVKALARLGRRTELYDPPYHLFDYSPRILTRMFREAGFQNVRIEIDAATRPVRLGPRLVSVAASWVGRVVHRLSGGRYLLRGVSKTALAER